MDIQSAIQAVTERRDLTSEEMTGVMRTIMSGDATQAQIGGFLVGLRMKGESVEEIAAAAGVMRELATRVEVEPTHLVDTAGTGGDGSKTFNISTTSVFVIAGAGGRVAKHGNRSASSSSGSADMLEAAGVQVDLPPVDIGRCIDEVGVGFMFAPMHHGAMRHAIGPRREMGVRTVFNLLGPLTNPAGAPNQVIGVFSPDWIEPLANVLGRLQSRHVMVVHSDDGLDEISVGAPTRVAELRNGRVELYTLEPERFGIERANLDSLVAESPQHSLSISRAVLSGEHGPARDIVLLNAGAAIYVCGVAATLDEAVELARQSIDSGAALERFDGLIGLSQQLSQ